MNDPRINISLGKCWQSSRGTIVFQCSTHDGNQRKKGYLELSSGRNDAPVSFTSEKPTGLLPAGGIAMLLRKHLSTCVVASLAISDVDSASDFMRLTCIGKNTKGESSRIQLIVAVHPEREISIILDSTSIARLKEDSQYTVPRPASHLYLTATDLNDDGFQAWLSSLFIPTTNTPQINVSPTDNVLPAYQRTARDRVARRLKTMKKTLAQDTSKVPDAGDIKDAKLDAKLLRDYLWLVKPGDFELLLDEAQTGMQARVIKINPDLTPGGNLESAFIRIKKLERALEIGGPRIKALQYDTEKLETILSQLRSEQGLSENDVSRLMQSVGLERAVPKSSVERAKVNKTSLPGRRFTTSTGQFMILGRNAEESDLIVKAAKSQDWWIHVAGGNHGSHVIVPGNVFRERLPDYILREAGILALHFSDRGNSREGEVYVARRHQIKKRKGMPAGLWQIDRAETVMIRYEPSDLAAIFARELREGIQRHTADL